MNSIYFIISIFPVFMCGMLVGTMILPEIINTIKLHCLTTAIKSKHIAENQPRIDRIKLRKSKVFKRRLKNIVNSIKEESQKGNRCLEIAYFQNCETDNEIYRELDCRNFRLDRHYQENTMKIYW